jgi:hypothetical protein
MAENLARMRSDQAAVLDPGAAAGVGRARWIVVAVVMAALLTLLIVGLMVHNQQSSDPAELAIPLPLTSAQMRFLEGDSSTLPGMVVSKSPPIVVNGEGQKPLDLNTILDIPPVGTPDGECIAPCVIP